MRRFERDGRFWEIEADGAFVVSGSGRLGTDGRHTRKRLASPAKARGDVEKRIVRRLAEGGWAEVVVRLRVQVDLTPRVLDLDEAEAARWRRDPRDVELDVAALAGLDAVVDALVHGPTLELHRPLDARWLAPGEPRRLRVDPSRVRLRELLLAADEPTWQRCLSLARGRAWPDDPGQREFELACAFAGTAVSDAAVAKLAPLPRDKLPFAEFASPDGFLRLVRVSGRGTLPRDLRAYLPRLLLRHGLSALPAVLALARQLGDDGLDLALRVRHADVVEYVLAAWKRAGGPGPAEEALRRMADWTLATLAERGVTGSALELARDLASDADLVADLLPLLDPAAQRRVRGWAGADEPEREAVDVLPAVLDAIARPQAPPWLNLARLPALLTDDDRVLTPEQRLVAVHVLRACDEDEVALDALVVLCSATSLSEFAVAVLHQWDAAEAATLFSKGRWYYEPELQRWMRDKSVPEGRTVPWPLRAVAAVGQPEACDALGRLLKDWGRRKGRYGELVQVGVDALAEMPWDSALTWLGALARTTSKARVAAELNLARVARTRGLHRDDVELVAIPTFDLAPGQPVILDVGPRRFEGRFDTTLRPVLVDEQGKRVKGLPRKRKTDDAAKASEASARWKQLTKDVRTTRTNLLRVFRRGLREERDWSGILQHLRTHPLASLVLSGLVFEQAGVPLRFDEAGDAVDVDEEPVALGGAIRLLHPVHQAPEVLGAWREHLRDYELIQPIEQLDRAHYRLDASEGPRMGDLVGTGLTKGALAALKHSGWEWRLKRLDEGGLSYLDALTLRLGTARVEVVFGGTPTLDELVVVTIARVDVDGGWGAHSPVVYSEVLRDLLRAGEIG